MKKLIILAIIILLAGCGKVKTSEDSSYKYITCPTFNLKNEKMESYDIVSYYPRIYFNLENGNQFVTNGMQCIIHNKKID